MARKKAERPPDPDRLVRAEAGRYRTDDERFEVSQESASSWYVTDSGRTDELGLARVTGPYATLAAVRAAIPDLRNAPPSVASLEERRRARGANTGKPQPEERERRRRAAPPPPPPPPPPTWLDRLEPEVAARARRLMAAAERAGLPDAERSVRRDVEGLAPRLAPAVLLRAVWRDAVETWDAAAVRDALEAAPAGLGDTAAARRALDDVAPEAAAALARAVARAAAARALEIAAGSDRAERGLPRWELDEVDERGERTERRIGITGDDLDAASRDPSG